MSSRDASEVTYRNNYRTRYINYYGEKNNSVRAIINIDGGSGAANQASEVTYLAIGRTQVLNSELGPLPIVPSLSLVSTIYVSVPPPLATVVTSAGVFITDGSSTLFGLSSGNVLFPAPITSLATDFSGNLYVSTSTAIYEHTGGGPVSMNITGLTSITALAVNSNIFYVVNAGSQIYAAYTSSAATLIAGSTPGFTDGPGSTAQFSRPGSLVLDPTGSILFVADTGNSLVRAISTVPPYTVSTLAGNSIKYVNPSPTDNVGNRDGSGIYGESLMFYPQGITISPYGVLYIADTINNNIRSLINGYLTTLAGKPGSYPTYDVSPPGYINGLTSNTLFTAPTSIFYYNSALYITEPSNGTVRVLTLV